MKKQLLSAPLAALVIAGLVTWHIGCSDVPKGVPAATAKPAVSQPAAPESSATSEADEQQASKLMTEGVTYIRTNKYPEAVKAFQEIIKIVKEDNPLMPVAYYNLACTYALMKDTKPALEYLGKAIKAGYNNRETIEADPDLVSLHEMPEYKAVMDLIPPITAITPITATQTITLAPGAVVTATLPLPTPTPKK
mgnify:CR=1 FL=1